MFHYKTIIIISSVFVITGLILPGYTFALKQPETMDEVRETGEKVLKDIQGQLPGILREVWQKEALPIWQKMWNFARPLWKIYVERQIDYWWFRIKDMAGIEIEKRKPAVEKEFKKEREEIGQELPGLTKNILERFRELIK